MCKEPAVYRYAVFMSLCVPQLVYLKPVEQTLYSAAVPIKKSSVSLGVPNTPYLLVYDIQQRHGSVLDYIGQDGGLVAPFIYRQGDALPGIVLVRVCQALTLTLTLTWLAWHRQGISCGGIACSGIACGGI